MIAQIVVGKEVPNLNQEHLIIGVDVAAYHLYQKYENIIAVGDFDSCSDDEWKMIDEHISTIIKHPSIKNDTDLALAIKYAIELGCDELFIYGAFKGNRVDHLIGNISLLKMFKDINIKLVDEHNVAYLMHPGKHQVKKSNKKYVSFFAVDEVSNLTLIGFKYPLTNYHLRLFDPLCVSNEIVESDAKVTFYDGLLLVFESND